MPLPATELGQQTTCMGGAGDHGCARQDDPPVGHSQAIDHGHADVPQEERARAGHAPHGVRAPCLRMP